MKQTNAVCDEMVSQIDLFPTLLGLAQAETETSMASSANDLGAYLKGETQEWREAVFMEQEEMRAVRTKDWLYVKRFQGAASYPLTDELYDLQADPHEKINLIDDDKHNAIKVELSGVIDDFFDNYSSAEYDLWKGGSAKSNVSFARFWRDAWGEDWQTDFG